MFLITVAVFLSLHLLALHSSIAGMEIFSTILILFACIGVFQKRTLFRTELQFPTFIFISAILLNFAMTPSLTPWAERLSELRWIFVYWGISKCLEMVWSIEFERKLLKLWVITLSIAAFYGLFQFTTGMDIVRSNNDHLSSMGGFFRATGFFSLCLTYAYSLGISGFSLSFPASKISQKLSYYTIGLTSLILLVSLARGAWVAFAGTVFILAIIYRKKLSRNQVLLLIPLFLLPFIFVLTNEGLLQRLQSLIAFKSDESVSIRFDLWRAYLQMFLENPLFGIGFEQGSGFLTEYYQKLNINQNFISHAHNDYIQILAETGIVGFGAFIFLIGSILRKTYQLGLYNFKWSVSLLAGQIYFLLSCLTQTNFTDAEVNHFLIFNWAVASALIIKVRTK